MQLCNVTDVSIGHIQFGTMWSVLCSITNKQTVLYKLKSIKLSVELLVFNNILRNLH